MMLTSGQVSGGAAKHLQRVIPLLAADPNVDAISVFVPEAVTSGVKTLGVPIVTWGARDALAGRKFLRRQLESFRADVVFIPTARWLDCGSTPTVTMVRNMEPLQAPFEGHRLPERLRNIARRMTAKRACRRADRVIAVSQHVRDFLVSQWGIPAEKVPVVYHGVEGPAEASRPASLPGIDGKRFLFTAGSIRPARGLTDLVAALPGIDRSVSIVVAGKVDSGAEHYKRKVDELARSHGVEESICWAGQLSAPEMSWCFLNSAAFVTTSRAEACPNTVLEAMSHGALSVSGDNAPMPEFFRDAALYYSIGNPASLASAIDQALQMPRDQQLAMQNSARARAAEFTWARTAETTLDVLRKAMVAG